MDGRQFAWKATVGYGIDVNTGMLVAQRNTAATFRVYRALPGDTLRLCDSDYEYAVALYAAQVDEKYIYTYDYEPEENWTTYCGNLSEGQYKQTDTVFENGIYFRVMLRKREGAGKEALEGAELGDILKWQQCPFLHENEALQADDNAAAGEELFLQELVETEDSVQKIQRKEALTLFLLSDSHYTVGGTWETTIGNIRRVNRRIKADGCIHLGDATDGLGSAECNGEIVKAMQRDFEEIKLPLYYVIGNHDWNYFRNNPDRLNRTQMYDLYLRNHLGKLDANVEKREAGEAKLWYHIDDSMHSLRMIFLDSFDASEKVRYGFSGKELDWLEGLLEQTPENWYTIVFSHVPPVPRLHYWSDEIRGSIRLTAMLRRYQRRSGNRLMGFIHGHNHADQIDLREGFPIISIGCAKCEYFEDKKPEGSYTYYREWNTVSQELWDVLVINTREERLDFIRFGAGENRTVYCGEQFGVICQGEKREDKRREARIPMKKVITYGTFDLFHEGHYNLLKRAKALGDYLIVGVTTEHYDEQRGKINIVDPMLERIENVRKCGFADEIIIEDHEGQKIEDIQKYGVDIFTLGSDWRGSFDYLKEYCEVVYLERTPDISSTMLRSAKFPIVRLGVVGTGRIAPRFIAEARYVSGLNIQSVYNIHKDSAERFAAEHEVEAFSEEFGAFLDTVDAIYIATPHETHYDYTEQALLHGKHVLCEKPMAFTKKEAKELFALAKEKGVVLMEGIKTAYCPGFAQLVNIAKSGKIGEIVDVEACFSRLTAPHLREMADAKYGGAFLEFGSYTVLPIIKLLGLNYKDVKFSSILAENGVDLYTKVYFDYAKGMATSKTGVGVKSEGQLLISGTEGYILAESPWWLTKKFQVRYEDPNKIETYTPKFLGDGLRYEISEFVSRINGRNKHPERMTEEESIAMTDVVERFMAEREKQRELFRERNQRADVKIWAHRGCSYEYPENTLPAFEAACKLQGIAGIELDVQLSKDGEVVVFHDETLERLTDGTGYLRDYTLKELQEMKFKALKRESRQKKEQKKPWKAEEVKIPTLGQVLELVKANASKQRIRINIELKNSLIRYEGMEEKVLELVKKCGMQESVVYSSFLPESLKCIKELDPNAKTGILHGDVSECARLALKLGAEALHPHVDSVQMRENCAEGTIIRAWNSREPFFGQDGQYIAFDLLQLRQKGVTDFITNIPEEYLERGK